MKLGGQGGYAEGEISGRPEHRPGDLRRDGVSLDIAGQVIEGLSSVIKRLADLHGQVQG